MRIVALLALLGMIVCWIIVLIKIFQNEGALKGILGFLCSLFAFIWGWMNASKYGIKNIMLIWTVLIIVYAIAAVMGGGFSYSMGTPVTP
jgi:hypothetical protein